MTILEAVERSFLEKITPLRGQQTWQGQAWQKFLQQGGLPDKSYEAYRYVHLRALYEGTRQTVPIVLPQVPSQVKILPLQEAWVQFRSYLDKQWREWLECERDPLALMHAGLEQQGLFLYVPAGVCVDVPIAIEHPMQLSIYVAKGASCQLRLKRDQKMDETGWLHRKVEAHLDEKASLKLQLDPHPASLCHLDTLRVTLKKEARFHGMVVPAASSLSRQDYHIRLLGELADAQLEGLVLTDEKQQQHVHVLMEHVAPHTTSRQHIKAVVQGRSRHSFEGKIYIHPQAQKVDAYQRHQALILSPYAESKSKPNLEIFADDVKASHGATCGQLDEEALFYLKARGLTHQKAREVLIQAFCAEVLHGLFT